MITFLFLTAFFLLINYLIYKNIDLLSSSFNLVDEPDNDLKKHSNTVFLMGGPIIFFNLSIIFLFIFLSENFKEIYIGKLFDKREFIVFYLLSFLFFFIGLLDDKYKINPNYKFLTFIFFIIILTFFDKNLLLSNIKIFNSTLEVNNIFLSSFFTIFCFLAFINAFNFFDGINLQVGFYSIYLVLVFVSKNFYIFFWITLLISIFLYLYLNYKNHSFLGDSGSLLLSFIFGYFFIYSHNQFDLFKADEIFLLMMLPGLDMIRLTIERIKNKKSPLFGDRSHIHHLIANKFGNKITPLITLVLSSLPFLSYLIFGNSFEVIVIFIIFYILFGIYLKKMVKKN
jgi:UDP-GlcNAc:undecaprenyl-phosphate GlcNAc-1-phosphate transferase